MHEPEQGYQTPLFITCSADPEECLRLLQMVHKPTGEIEKKALVQTFATSRYLKYYGHPGAPEVEMIDDDDVLWGVVRSHIIAHFTRVGGTYEMTKADATKAAKGFIDKIKAETLTAAGDKLIVELLDEVSGVAMRIWSSTVKYGSSREFCSFLNESIRSDWPETVEFTAQLARCINQLLVNRRGIDAEKILRSVKENGCEPTLSKSFPGIEKIFDNAETLEDDEAHWCVTFRGGGILASKKPFFRAGTKYRVPQFLATSFNKTVATDFMKRRETGHDAIKWYIHAPLGYCQHAALLEKSNMGSAEFEYLFTPFSVFTVLHVKWSDDPRNAKPHVIHLRCTS